MKKDLILTNKYKLVSETSENAFIRKEYFLADFYGMI